GHARAAQIVGTLPRPALWLISLNYGAPPLFSWLAAPFTHLNADPLLATRLASAVVGTVGLLIIWAAGRALWGPVAALLAAALGLLLLLLLLLTPQGGGLLAATHAHTHAVAQPLAVIVGQLVTLAQAIWLYLTPPVLALAVLGLWTMRHERAARLLAPWAL